MLPLRNSLLLQGTFLIAGTHLLILMSIVYDPAVYFTTDEMHQKGVHVDVPTIVETPEVHILGRSSSSIADQRMFNDCRRESLAGFNETISTEAGIPITYIW